ncbi:MAG: patatin-like phospholipase family protein [Thermoanaerobaculia bacterium]|jgi:NTE family protein
MVRRLRSVATAILIALALPVVAQEHRPKIGLALSGGGAKGFAHVGVLKVLEEMNIPIDYIAGTSMGAVVGSLYASGMSPDEIEKKCAEIDWNDALDDSTSYSKLVFRRKQDISRYPSTIEFGRSREGKLKMANAYRTGQKLSFLLGRFLYPVLDQHDFSKFPVPFVAVATDLETGEAVILDKGNIAEVVRASMSIPGVFTTVEIDGRLLVDGGTAMNVPVEAVRAMGADIVIAIDIGAPLAKRDEMGSSLAIMSQLSTMLTRGNMTRSLTGADLILTPDITGYGTFDFEKSAEITDLGVVEANAKRAELQKYAVDGPKLQRTRLGRDRAFVVDEISVVGNKFVEAEFVRQQMHTEVGKPLDLDVLEEDVQRLYGYGDFNGISFSTETIGGKNDLVIRVTEKPWGPNYIRTGIAFNVVPDDVNVDLLLNLSKRWLNARGAEWRTDVALGQKKIFETEIYQPRRNFSKSGFVSAGLTYTSDKLDLYADGDRVAQFDTDDLMLITDLGFQFGTKGEARLGLFGRSANGEISIGPPNLGTYDEDYGGVRAKFLLDTRDNPFIPLSGASVLVEGLAAFESTGATTDNVVVTIDANGWTSAGRSTFTYGLYLHDTVTGTSSALDWSFLGGLFNHSGYARGELLGPASAMARLGWYFELAELTSVVGRGIYAGGFVEAGDTYLALDDIDLGELKYSYTALLGLNTNYGPVFAAISKGSTNDGLQYYVTVGKSF